MDTINSKVDYPAPEYWPERLYRLPELRYPEALNACCELLDRNLLAGRGAFPAIFHNDTQIRYEDLFQQVCRWVRVLNDIGIQRGDRVVLRLLNRPHFISVWLALIRMGAVVVATPPVIKARELAAISAKAAPRLLISESELLEEVHKLPPLPLKVETVEYLSELAIQADPLCDIADTSRDDLAIIGFTSGSTGVPKGCMHSHVDLMSVTDSYARYVLQPSPEDRFGGHPTMAFVYGLGGLLLFPLRFGASTVLTDRFTPESFADSLEKYRTTIAFCAPTSLRMMLKSCPDLRQKVQSLRCVVTAGETLPAPVYRSWTEQTNVEVLDGIGSTEMLHIFISCRPGHSRPGSTGEAVPGYEARVADPVSLETVADGTAGLLAVRGPTGCRYLGLDSKQQEYVRNGWNFPGDIYVRDEEGFFHYQCRNDDLIICAGNNVAGPEIESVLQAHPEVLEVSVVASPDELRGMIPKAFIVLRRPATNPEALKEELQQFVLGELASYKCPRRIEFVDELPKTSTGKIQRSALRRKEFAAG